MPGGDRTGPMGMGGMTGRGAGYCAGSGMPGYANPGFGRGFGTGFSRGSNAWRSGFGGGRRGRRNMFCATGLPGWTRFGGYADPDPESEKQALENRARHLRSELEFIEKRLGEIKAGAEEQ